MVVSDKTDSVGLIVVVSIISRIEYTRVLQRRTFRTITNTVKETKVSNGTGFLVQNPITSEPSIVSVAHLIPTDQTAENTFYIKLFDRITKLSKIYKINLIAYNRGVDVALFTFETPITNPEYLTWNLDSLTQGQDCYLMGYPLGDSQLSIVEGSVRDPTYCFSDLASGVDQIYHSAPATNGNSGSCILDASGNIIGIHAWGYYQNNEITFENFTGGPSTKSIYPIILHILTNPSKKIGNFYPRLILGIQAKIVNDIYRIVNFSNQALQNIDGILVSNILPNGSFNRHNAIPSNTKIELNDILTHIFDYDKNDYVEIGYTRESPINILFRNPFQQSIKIKLRKVSQNYSQELVLEIVQPVVQSIAQDTFYSNLL
jgi:S1-C subfamily serine protease